MQYSTVNAHIFLRSSSKSRSLAWTCVALVICSIRGDCNEVFFRPSSTTGFPQIGASPDGILHCICFGKGCLDIKCPAKHNKFTVLEACVTGTSVSNFATTHSNWKDRTDTTHRFRRRSLWLSPNTATLWCRRRRISLLFGSYQMSASESHVCRRRRIFFLKVSPPPRAHLLPLHTPCLHTAAAFKSFGCQIAENCNRPRSWRTKQSEEEDRREREKERTYFYYYRRNCATSSFCIPHYCYYSCLLYLESVFTYYIV